MEGNMVPNEIVLKVATTIKFNIPTTTPTLLHIPSSYKWQISLNGCKIQSHIALWPFQDTSKMLHYSQWLIHYARFNVTIRNNSASLAGFVCIVAYFKDLVCKTLCCTNEKWSPSQKDLVLSPCHAKLCAAHVFIIKKDSIINCPKKTNS